MKYKLVFNNKIKMKKSKQNDKSYIFELEKFLDRASNIKDKELQNDIIIQMLRCDKALTELYERMFRKFFIKGYKKLKNE